MRTIPYVIDLNSNKIKRNQPKNQNRILHSIYQKNFKEYLFWLSKRRWRKSEYCYIDCDF